MSARCLQDIWTKLAMIFLNIMLCSTQYEIYFIYFIYFILASFFKLANSPMCPERLENSFESGQTQGSEPYNAANFTLILPWGIQKEKTPYPPSIPVDPAAKPGQFVLRSLFAEFAILAEKKIDAVLSESLERQLSKSLQRGEDPVFDQIVSGLGTVAEHCLPSLLRTLFAWYERQEVDTCLTQEQKHKSDGKGKGEPVEKGEKDQYQEKRDLPYHPGHEDLVNYIENLAFKHFRYREGFQNAPNAANIHIIADLYAEVTGVLAQSNRFQSVRKKFMAELKELRNKEQNPVTSQSIISLLMGMKFFRVKMVPIEEFEASFQFMQECAQYFLEVKDKDVKHALAGLFVEILVPVAATVKNEVNVPVLKNFVEMLYSQTLDMCTKKKHILALFPLVTCLLCVSQKSFFLQNWHYFLAMCLSNLKNKDPKMSRVALESLYRLLWVYMIRIKCESNTATQSRLQSIVNSLFPKGSKAVVPRETPLNIFVKIIQFVAQERLDFAMREIVFDLLSVGRPIKIILTPERMSIGLRAFLVVADSLQQKEGDPPMPRTVGVLPSGNTLRVKKTFLNKTLTEDTAKAIGMSQYYPFVRKTFDDILRALDVQFGRPLMMTMLQNVNKEPDEMITSERKPKIDLFRTCVAAIPRLIPDGMNKHDLVDLLSRLTVHIDEELRGLAFQSLQTMMNDFPDWREDVMQCFIQFILKEVNDTFPQLLDNSLRMLLQFLNTWKNSLTSSFGGSSRRNKMKFRLEPSANILHYVEGFGLVMLSNCRLAPRRLAIHILKEVKCLLLSIPGNKEEEPVIDVIDKACSIVTERCLPLLPAPERLAIIATANIDLQWLCERGSSIWPSAPQDTQDSTTKKAAIPTVVSGVGNVDTWAVCLMGFLERECILSRSPAAVAHSWPIAFSRVATLLPYIDPNPVTDNRASLLRSSTTIKKPLNERDIYTSLWRNYIMFACRVAPPASSPVIRCASPELSLGSSPDSIVSDRSENRSPSPSVPASNLYKLIVPLLRCENPDVRDAVVLGLGKINHEAIKDLMEELMPYIKEAIDRKQENMRRRRRRDALRVQLVKVMEFIAAKGTFGISPSILNRDSSSLSKTFIEYIDGARLYLENDNDKDVSAIQDIKLHFCGFIHKLIKSFPLDCRNTLIRPDLRKNLFYLFASWSGRFGVPFGFSDKQSSKSSSCSDFEFLALQAMASVLCCGLVFDQQGFADDGYLYSWLDILLGTHDEKIYELAQETIVLLLEFNPDLSSLLDWVVDRCYTGSNEVADGCFNALATIFSAREYPCDHYTAIINVTLMNTGCPRANICETALQLLQVLDKRFFGSLSPLMDEQGETGDGLSVDVVLRPKNVSTLDVLLSTSYSRSQQYLTKQLAQLHPELTMPIFSEITHRFQTARNSVQQILLQYLLPWLYNMELVDPSVPPCIPLAGLMSRMSDMFNNSEHGSHTSVEREGWGSAEASEMVLNNLFYISVKFGDEYSKDIENLWAALSSCWTNNLRVILRYLFIISGISPNELLPYSKRVVLYLARAQPERLIDEMLNELQTVETLNCLIERTETPPFFRLTSMRKASSHSDNTSNSIPTESGSKSDLVVEKGTLHTKRHSGVQVLLNLSAFRIMKIPEGNNSVKSTSSLPSVSPKQERSRNSTFSMDNQQVEEDNFSVLRKGGMMEEGNKVETPQPHPLPMPEYGGYFAPLTAYLPDSSQPISSFHRCNLAVIFLVDLVVDGIDIDWTIHVPLILHIIFLGMDHTRSIVHDHCKKLLLNLLIVLAGHKDHLTVAKILLNSKTEHQRYGLTPLLLNIPQHNYTEPESTNVESKLTEKNVAHTEYETVVEQNIRIEKTNVAAEPQVEADKDVIGAKSPTEDVIMSMINFLSNQCHQLWIYEDITSKVWSTKSTEQLTNFFSYVLKIFKESLPIAHIEERWAQIALHIALSCPSRHYAGRSLQIFRALKVTISSRMLSDILSRLVETVAEQGEDMQGYVTEIMLTLEAAVESLDPEQCRADFMKDLMKSNVVNKDSSRKMMPPFATMSGYPSSHQVTGHARSTSFTAALYHNQRTSSLCGWGLLGSPTSDLKEGRARCGTEVETRMKSNLSRSRSAQSLKFLADQSTLDDRASVIAQLFWLSVSLLESDYEYEILLAVRLMDKVLGQLSFDQLECREKIEKLQLQLKWNNFPGVHALLLKGCTSPLAYEPTLHLLAKFTPMLDSMIVDPSQATAFPINVIALLPYMLQNYDDPNTICIKSAENIAQVCMEKCEKLENLATVMTLYSKRTFSKESFQWTKCVVKYLYDAYSHLSLTMMVFLVEVLEKGPQNIVSHVLSIIYCMLHYLDMNSAPVQPVNTDMLRVVARHVEGNHWKEAMKILKLIVTRSSTLSAPPTGVSMQSSITDVLTSLPSSLSFADTDSHIKKELPGRTMEFTFDISQTPVIGRRYQTSRKSITTENHKENNDNQASPRRSASVNQSDVGNGISGWRRPYLSQARTRERLVNLLMSCGQRVGLPKSPSVIFSQSSDLLERHSSMCSSTEEVSIINNDMSAESKLDDTATAEQQFGVFKDFDFLEYELESQEGESIDNFNWGVRRRSLTNLDGNTTDTRSSMEIGAVSYAPVTRREESSDDEIGSVSPVEDASNELDHSNIGMMFPPNTLPGLLNSSSHHHTESSQSSSSSTCSENDLGDITPSNNSPSFMTLLATFAHSDEIEEIWRSHVNTLMSESTPATVLSTPQVFKLLFKIIKCRLVEKVKFCVLEIQEHFETFLERKANTIECLDSIKTSLRLLNVGERISQYKIEEQRVELCKCLYKIHFQIILLFESFSKLIMTVSMATSQNEIQDLWNEVVILREEITQGIQESNASTSFSFIESSANSRSAAEQTIIDLTIDKKYNDLVNHIHAFRETWPNSSFGSGEEEDIDVVLNLYCRHLCEKKSGVMIITKPENKPSDVCDRLMNANVHLCTTLRSVEQILHHQERLDNVLRKTESTLNVKTVPRLNVEGSNGQCECKWKLVDFESPDAKGLTDYQVLNMIGRGGFASVYRAKVIDTDEEVAIKMIDKKRIRTSEMISRVNQEVEIHLKLKHPSILELYTYFEDSEYIYLVLEMCSRGNCKQHVERLKRNLLESEARHFMVQIIQGMLYLHSHNILHRDLTLANILFTENLDIKIADFGLATELKNSEEKHLTMCGTPNFMSPEIATRGEHGFEADVWSLGIMFYTFLTGNPPFDTNAVKSTFTQVVMADYVIPENRSPEAIKLIDALLKKNPKDRIKLCDVMKHPFMAKALQELCASKKFMTSDADSGIITMGSTSLSQSSRQLDSSHPSHLSAINVDCSQCSSHCSHLRQHHLPSPPVRMRSRPREPHNGIHYNLKNGSINQLKSKFDSLPSMAFNHLHLERTATYNSVVENKVWHKRQERDISEERRLQEKERHIEERYQKNATKLTRKVFTGNLGRKLYGEEKSSENHFSDNQISCHSEPVTHFNNYKFHETASHSSSNPCIHKAGLSVPEFNHSTGYTSLPKECSCLNCSQHMSENIHGSLNGKEASQFSHHSHHEKFLDNSQTSKNEGNDNKSSPKKGLQLLASPLNTKRLKSTRQCTKNAVIHILENGDISVEFLKKRHQEERVVDVVRISADGIRIIIYQPNNGRGQPVSKTPVVIPPEGTDLIFNYENLPQKYWKKYAYAARFVKLVKAKTPKITFYNDQSKCMLMENSPQSDFESSFYSGAKVILSSNTVKVMDNEGRITTLDTTHPTQLQGLVGETKQLYELFNQNYSHCLRLEKLLENMSETTDQLCFPIIVGRKPSLGPSTLPSPSQDKENVSAANKNSFSFFLLIITLTVLHHQSSSVSRSVPLLGEGLSMSFPILPVRSSASAVTLVTYGTSVISTFTEINDQKGQNMQSQPLSTIQTHSFDSKSKFRDNDPEIITASQVDGDSLQVEYNNGAQITITSQRDIIYTDTSTNSKRFGKSDNLPPYLTKLLVKVQNLSSANVNRKPRLGPS
ncbi:Protein furry -like [Nymphon striatum]|nr:Protein furry -like [Nymphon striatum]